MNQVLSIIATLAGILFVGWAMIVHPVQNSDNAEESGNQLTGLIFFLVVVALIVAFVLFILPYIAVIMFWLLIAAVVLILGFVLTKILRPLLPRFARSLKRMGAALRQYSPKAVRAAGRMLRLMLQKITQATRWILRPSRWARLLWRMANFLRFIGRHILHFLRAIRKRALAWSKTRLVSPASPVQESQVERSDYQHNSYIHHQSFPE